MARIKIRIAEASPADAAPALDCGRRGLSASASGMLTTACFCTKPEHLPRRVCAPPRSQRGVARIVGDAGRAPGNMEAEPERPKRDRDRNEPCGAELAANRSKMDKRADDADSSHAERPDRIDPAGIGGALLDQPGQRHHQRQTGARWPEAPLRIARSSWRHRAGVSGRGAADHPAEREQQKLRRHATTGRKFDSSGAKAGDDRRYARAVGRSPPSPRCRCGAAAPRAVSNCPGRRLVAHRRSPAAPAAFAPRATSRSAAYPADWRRRRSPSALRRAAAGNRRVPICRSVRQYREPDQARRLEPLRIERKHGGDVGAGRMSHDEHPLRIAAESCRHCPAPSARPWRRLQEIRESDFRDRADSPARRQRSRARQRGGQRTDTTPWCRSSHRPP